MEPLFTVHSMIDRKLLTEAIWRKTRLFVIIAECVLLAALSYFAFICIGAYRNELSISPLYFIVAFALLLYMIFWTVYRNYSMVNRQIKQFQATFGQPSAELEYRFFEDHFEEHNPLTGGKATLDYAYLTLVLRCKNQLLGRYRAATLHLPYKGISGGTADELEIFLKSRMEKK